MYFGNGASDAKMHGTTFEDVYICYRLTPLRKLRLMNLTDFFKVKIRICNICETVRAGAACEMTLRYLVF